MFGLIQVPCHMRNGDWIRKKWLPAKRTLSKADLNLLILPILLQKELIKRADGFLPFTRYQPCSTSRLPLKTWCPMDWFWIKTAIRCPNRSEERRVGKESSSR